MRGRPYYEEPEYHNYLISRERRELFDGGSLLSQLKWDQTRNLLDFGMGNGYYLSYYYKYMNADCQLWGAECQEILIDSVLQRKVREGLERFIPFYVERTEHPLLPDWIPPMDIIWCSCVMSTFADPSLAIQGVGRSMANDGHMIILDWEKKDAPSGPETDQKISSDRMRFFIEDAGYNVNRILRTNEFLYAFEIEKGENARKQSTFDFARLDY